MEALLEQWRREDSVIKRTNVGSHSLEHSCLPFSDESQRDSLGKFDLSIDTSIGESSAEDCVRVDVDANGDLILKYDGHIYSKKSDAENAESIAPVSWICTRASDLSCNGSLQTDSSLERIVSPVTAHNHAPTVPVVQNQSLQICTKRVSSTTQLIRAIQAKRKRVDDDNSNIIDPTSDVARTTKDSNSVPVEIGLSGGMDFVVIGHPESRQYLVINDYIFSRNKLTHKVVYWRCKDRLCRSYARTDLSKLRLLCPPGEHSHPPCEDAVNWARSSSERIKQKTAAQSVANASSYSPSLVRSHSNPCRLLNESAGVDVISELCKTSSLFQPADSLTSAKGFSDSSGVPHTSSWLLRSLFNDDAEDVTHSLSPSHSVETCQHSPEAEPTATPSLPPTPCQPEVFDTSEVDDVCDAPLDLCLKSEPSYECHQNVPHTREERKDDMRSQEAPMDLSLTSEMSPGEAKPAVADSAPAATRASAALEDSNTNFEVVYTGGSDRCVLVRNGFIFTRNKTSQKSVYWRCRNKYCRNYLHTDIDMSRITGITGVHNHASESDAVAKFKSVSTRIHVPSASSPIGAPSSRALDLSSDPGLAKSPALVDRKRVISTKRSSEKSSKDFHVFYEEGLLLMAHKNFLFYKASSNPHSVFWCCVEAICRCYIESDTMFHSLLAVKGSHDHAQNPRALTRRPQPSRPLDFRFPRAADSLLQDYTHFLARSPAGAAADGGGGGQLLPAADEAPGKRTAAAAAADLHEIIPDIPDSLKAFVLSQFSPVSAVIHPQASSIATSTPITTD